MTSPGTQEEGGQGQLSAAGNQQPLGWRSTSPQDPRPVPPAGGIRRTRGPSPGTAEPRHGRADSPQSPGQAGWKEPAGHGHRAQLCPTEASAALRVHRVGTTGQVASGGGLPSRETREPTQSTLSQWAGAAHQTGPCPAPGSTSLVTAILSPGAGHGCMPSLAAWRTASGRPWGSRRGLWAPAPTALHTSRAGGSAPFHGCPLGPSYLPVAPPASAPLTWRCSCEASSEWASSGGPWLEAPALSPGGLGVDGAVSPWSWGQDCQWPVREARAEPERPAPGPRGWSPGQPRQHERTAPSAGRLHQRDPRPTHGAGSGVSRWTASAQPR